MNLFHLNFLKKKNNSINVKTYNTKSCRFCNMPFSPIDNNQNYCSRKHAQLDWYKKKIGKNPPKVYSYTCAVCKIAFTHRFPPHAKNSPKVCRNKECIRSRMNLWQRLNLGFKYTKYDGTRDCSVCGKNFDPIKERGHKNWTTCSIKCEKDKEREESRLWRHKKYSKQGHVIGKAEPEDAIFKGNYKEPMRKVVNGYGFYGALRYSPSIDAIQCHECGEWYKALYGGYKGHLTKHKLDNQSYKEKYEISRTTKLISEGLRKKYIDNFLARDITFKQNAAAAMERMKDNIEYKRTMTGKRRRLETRNKMGNCPDQLLEKLQIVANENNGVVSRPLMKKRWGSEYGSTIELLFGSYKEARRLVGAKDGQHKFKYTKEQLLEFLANFYKEKGRVPVNSDFKRGYLPSQHAYRRQFGSLNEARRQAGVPQLYMSGRGRWLEAKNLQNTIPAISLRH